jgi:UDP-N-acetylglucosamine 2-epimerase (non-hydrolysing)
MRPGKDKEVERTAKVGHQPFDGPDGAASRGRRVCGAQDQDAHGSVPLGTGYLEAGPRRQISRDSPEASARRAQLSLCYAPSPPYVMIALVAGTRPNFMKVAPVWRALQSRSVPTRLIHTGQHFDSAMSDVFFRDLAMPEPDLRLECGGGTHAEQTAAVLVGMERDLLRKRPRALVVVGDVTSTLAAALAAAKLGIQIAHVEAGLRSRDWTMPEEINRVLTDQLSDLLLTPSVDADVNLLAEGIPRERVRFVGNVMIDSLHWARRQRTEALERFALRPGRYALATLHRPVNVDSPEAFNTMISALETIASRVPVLFPVHPRTLSRAASLGLAERLHGIPGLTTCDPVGYNDFVTLMSDAQFVATDSGGVQEETTALGIPCLTLRSSTERPITVDQGTNVVVGMDPERIATEVDTITSGRAKHGTLPEGWDGHASERVADALLAMLEGKGPPPKAAP